MSKLIKISVLVLVFVPAVASAQVGGLGGLLGQVDMIVRFSIPLLAGIALLVFLWGLVKFIFAQGSETIKAEAKKIMGWGIVALFVMVSVWGIVRFIQDALLPGANFGPPPFNLIP
ncbi:MAG: hypothetical protein Q8P21_02480 [bacterium]|nr:hypothetical protein [bacterium]